MDLPLLKTDFGTLVIIEYTKLQAGHQRITLCLKIIRLDDIDQTAHPLDLHTITP
jgi:hypothetical protein